MKILILGSSGMIGSTMLQVLNKKKEWDVKGTVRQESAKILFPHNLAKQLIVNPDLNLTNSLADLLENAQPNLVINCAGITKHQASGNDPEALIPINSLLPHRLLRLCNERGSRLIHISTDCVFSGAKGAYTETDLADAQDWYGKSKTLGEIIDTNAVTLRTSTIGAELNSQYGLLEWFLSQKQTCNGYAQAIFSGLPTVVFAKIVRDIVIPRQSLSGLYHIGADPISKFELLQLISQVYDKKIHIQLDDKLKINRSLDVTKFHNATGYKAPAWLQLIKQMHEQRKS